MWPLLTLKHKKETVKLLCLLLMAANMQQPSLWYRQRSYWPPDLQSSALPTELNPLVTVTRADICLVISITAAVHLQWHANAFCHRLPPWTPTMATRCIVIWCLHLPACACMHLQPAYLFKRVQILLLLINCINISDLYLHWQACLCESMHGCGIPW